MKRFVTSDSHGGYKALVHCLERCGFDKEIDQLIFLGDVVDGWSESKESIELLLSCKHLVYLLGNHDQWALEYYTGQLEGKENVQLSWLRQGGAATVKSYGDEMTKSHLELLQNAKPYHITDDNILFVHAGFDTRKPIEENDTYTLLWSRNFVEKLYTQYTQRGTVHINKYKAVYIGHTPTFLLEKNRITPLHLGNVTLIDTGAAFTGCLSIIDVDSQEVWQSDKVMALYPDEEGRNGLSWRERNLFRVD